MHEMGIANSVLDAIRVESRRFPEGHIYKVGVRIGELAGVDPEAMSFCFEALVRGTELEPLDLEIEYCPRSYQCRACKHTCAATREEWTCPACGMTTCFAWMMRGQLRNAFFANPFGILMFAGTVALIPAAMVLLWQRISLRRITDHAWFNKAVYGSTALLLVSWMFKLAEFHLAAH